MPVDHPLCNQNISSLGGNFDLEIAHMTILDRLRIESTGGLFAERHNDFSGFQRVLDIVSRTGTWALSVARQHSEVEVVCLNSHHSALDATRGQAEIEEIENIRFVWVEKEADLIHCIFPDNYFDLINVSELFALLRAKHLLAFFKECLRITKPGGYIRFTESEWGITTSPAIEKLAGLFLKGLRNMGRTPSPDGRNLGVNVVSSNLLQQAGWRNIERRAYVEDYLMGPSMPSDPATRIEIMINTMRKTILDQQMATQERLNDLIQQSIVEIGQDNFNGLAFFLVFCAQKD